MRLLLPFLIFVVSGCSTSLSIIDSEDYGEGIEILSKTDNLIVAKVVSYPTRSYQFFLNEINKYASNQCASNYEISISENIIPVIAYECRAGGCGEFPDKAYVYEIKCPNNTP